jgi:3-isopropylmalate/(R)-2-methylmalate dehydratase small subunit
MSPRAPITRFTSRYVVLRRPNIDTDQIIPARFLKTTQRTGLGPHAFHDWRYRADGSPDPEFALNRPGAAGAEILVAGENFGCGSSREHAVWALQGAGFRAVVSVKFGDIFRGNALANGLVPIEVPQTILDMLTGQAGSDGRTVGRSDGRSRSELTVDLANQSLILPDGTATPFALPPFSRHCLINGVDELDFLMSAGPDIGEFERGQSPRVSTLAP